MNAVRGLLLVIVVLALIFYAGGGWYFAGQIEADALLVEDDEPDPNDVRVASVDAASIDLEELADSDGQIHNDGLYGISWDGGFGRLGDGGNERAEVLTRPFTLLDLLLDCDLEVGEAGPQAGNALAGLVVAGVLGQVVQVPLDDDRGGAPQKLLFVAHELPFLSRRIGP